jgi:23S rRNA (adenine2030-N6)-methyltransferase
MLSYRHAYHAGNHADVLKHIVLLALLEHLRQKEKPFIAIDTHSGNGYYRLDSHEAKKTHEAASGIIPLWQARQRGDIRNELLGRYLDIVAGFNPAEPAPIPDCYPGSPAFMQTMLREHDRAHLMELHTTEIDYLRDNFGRDRRISIHHRDGFEGAVALCPPTPRRGLLLMDPAYEDKADYQQAVKAIAGAYKRWQTGIFVLWYPRLGRSRDHSDWLKKQLTGQYPSAVFELDVERQTEEFGMYGSGMLIINPPWQFETTLTPVLAELHAMLAVK